MKARAALIGALFFLAATSAFAQDDDEEEELEPTRAGVYVAGAATAVFEHFTSKTVPSIGANAGGSVALGYRNGEFLSFEGEFAFFDGNKGQTTVSIWTTSLNFRVHIPVGRIEPYLTYGAGLMNGSGGGGGLKRFDDIDFFVKGGGGVQFHVNNYWSLYTHATYAFPLSGVKGLEHTTLAAGALYKF